MKQEGEQVFQDHARTDIFEEFSILEFLWAPRPRCRLISQEGFFVDESTALPSALDGTKEVGLSYHTAITLCQDFSDISARPSGSSWKEARKAECEVPEVFTSLQCSAGRPLRKLQKDHNVFGFSPNVGIRRAPHPAVFPISPGCYTRVNGHRFVGWRVEMMKGKGL